VKKYFISTIAINCVFLLFALLNPTPSIAAQIDPYGFCNRSTDTCRTPAPDPRTGETRNWSCQTPFDMTGSTPDTCTPDLTAGKNCPGKGAKCSLIDGNANNGGCCEHDVDGSTPLACDSKTDTCVDQRTIACDPADPTCNTCAKENEACGPAAKKECCSEVAGNLTLSCAGAGGEALAPSQDGTCKKIDRSQKKIWPTMPPPPPPPCAEAIDANGKCNNFASAFGLLGTAPEQFITSLFAVLLSISGGVALLLIVKAGYQMMTSQGKPEQLNAGRDQLVAAIVGLVFLIFSFVILQVIGFDILQIPGFGG
jgi:hypothetical protein